MSQQTDKTPPRLPGSLPLIGHIGDFGKNPHTFMMKLRAELGDVAEFKQT